MVHIYYSHMTANGFHVLLLGFYWDGEHDRRIRSLHE